MTLLGPIREGGHRANYLNTLQDVCGDRQTQSLILADIGLPGTEAAKIKTLKC